MPSPQVGLDQFVTGGVRVRFTTRCLRNPLPPFGSLGDVRRAGDVLRQAQASQGNLPSIEKVREAREVIEAYGLLTLRPCMPPTWGCDHA